MPAVSNQVGLSAVLSTTVTSSTSKSKYGNNVLAMPPEGKPLVSSELMSNKSEWTYIKLNKVSASN